MSCSWRIAVIAASIAFAGCVSIDYEALRARAQKGDAQAQFELGVAYDFGHGIRRDSEEAARWYLAAAEQGHAAAENSVGSIYQAGVGVPQEHALAVVWYQKSADQGNAEAMNNLAYMYDLGFGVAEDNRRAAELYERSAEALHVRAMLNLGILLVQGQDGVDKDIVEAYKWLDLARFYTQGTRDMQLKWRSRAALDELEASMTSDQIAEAKRRVKAWDREYRLNGT